MPDLTPSASPDLLKSIFIFWSLISNLLPTLQLFFSAASKRDVHIRLMLSERAYTYKHRKEHLQSLLEYNKRLRKILFEVKVFHVSHKIQAK